MDCEKLESKNPDETSKTPIADRIEALGTEILSTMNESKACLLHKKGALTLKELQAKGCDLGNRVYELNKAIPGNLSTGADIELEDRGLVSDEINSARMLKAYQARYRDLTDNQAVLEKRIDSIAAVLNEEKAQKLKEAGILINTGFVVPTALVTFAATIFGNENQVILFSVWGATVILGAGLGKVIIRRANAPKAANDNGTNAHKKVFEFRKARNGTTLARHRAYQFLKTGTAVCRRKRWTKTSEPLMIASRLSHCFGRNRHQGPRL